MKAAYACRRCPRMSGVPTFQRFAARLGMASAILLAMAGAYLILYWWPFLARSAPFG